MGEKLEIPFYNREITTKHSRAPNKSDQYLLIICNTTLKSLHFKYQNTLKNKFDFSDGKIKFYNVNYISIKTDSILYKGW